MIDKSPDAFRTISEAADELDVPQHVLRFWETRFAQVKPMKRAGGRRYYRPADVELLKGIRSLLYKDGYTIRGVQKILKEDGAAYVAGVGRGDIEPRKREDEMAGAPPPGTAKAAPRLTRGTGPSGAEDGLVEAQALLPLEEPGAADDAGPSALPAAEAEALRTALRELAEARRILDPTLPP